MSPGEAGKILVGDAANCVRCGYYIQLDGLAHHYTTNPTKVDRVPIRPPRMGANYYTATQHCVRSTIELSQLTACTQLI